MNRKELNIKVIILIIASASLLAIIYNAFSSDGIDWIRKPLVVKTIEHIDESGNKGELLAVDLETTLNVFNNNNAIFIDARDQWEFSDGHIQGAINLPEFNFEENIYKLKSIDKSSLIIVYCDGDDCDISKRLASKLIKLKYDNVYVFVGGFNQWKNAQLPISKGNLNE